MSVNWTERISAFSRSPSQFLCSTTAEIFLTEVLRELRDDRANDHIKVLLLSPLLEHPTLLCPSVSVGEETALELMSVFAQCSPKSLQLRCHLLLAITSVLLCSSCVMSRTSASQDFLEVLFQMTQDTNDLQAGAAVRPLRTTACECLRELEACHPGLLSQRLELLSTLRQQENSRLHQAYTGLHALALRNAVYLLTQQKGAGAEHLKAALGSSEGFVWAGGADSEFRSDTALLSCLNLGPMGRVPTLQTGPDAKELRSLISSFLEESYLLTSLSQAALLQKLVEILSMVPAVSPTIFRAQLLRLLGTCEVCLLHATLLMKAAFTDSLFSAEDEAYLLKRLVNLSQHPLQSPAEKLFYMDCILHFPENRPISSGDENLPVLLTPRLAAALVPTLFNDSASMLARLNLLSLVYLEEGEEDGDGQGHRGLAYLYDHLMSLLRVMENQGSREMVVTFFRASFLFLLHFCHVKCYAEDLIQRLCDMYLGQTRLAPHLVNLADRTQDRLEESGWALALLRSLQRSITEAPLSRLTLQDLRWHLRVLARVADEGDVPQRATLGFLLSVITSSSSVLCASGDWRLGNGMLGVCRRLLLHPSLDSLLTPLADLLQYLTCHYGDTDIRDHARLYYTLLTTLSREKLAGVMALGVPERGRQAKVRSLSAIMTETEELTTGLTVHQTEEPLLRLVKLDSQEPGDPEPDSQAQIECDSAPRWGREERENYRAKLLSPSFVSEITHHYHLTHTGVPDHHFNKLFSIRLHFDLTDNYYEEVSDISVPCLFRTRKPPLVKLRLKPKQPYPTTLRASAVFTSEDGLSWHSSLADLHVTFPEVFLPLPATLGWTREQKNRVFEEIWREISSVESKGDSDNAATSLFCDQLDNWAMGKLVKNFQRYQIPYCSELDKGGCKVLFFLPPQSHVLLRVLTVEENVQIHIATDNWKLLPYINSYLEDITKDLHTASL